jgi:hypothetical protein
VSRSVNLRAKGIRGLEGAPLVLGFGGMLFRSGSFVWGGGHPLIPQSPLLRPLPWTESLLTRTFVLPAASFWQFPFSPDPSGLAWPFEVPIELFPFRWLATLLRPRGEIGVTAAARPKLRRLDPPRVEPVLRVSGDVFTSLNPSDVVHDLIPALVDEFLRSKLHNREEL